MTTEASKVRGAFEDYFSVVLAKTTIKASYREEGDTLGVGLAATIDGENYIVRQWVKLDLTDSEAAEIGNSLIRQLSSTYSKTIVMNRLLNR